MNEGTEKNKRLFMIAHGEEGEHRDLNKIHSASVHLFIHKEPASK